jgi:uncharacterized membrane protein YbhN (UPF0104 family)
MADGGIGRLRKSAIAVVGLVISAVSIALIVRTVDVGKAAAILGGAAFGPALVGLLVFLIGLGGRFLITRTLLPPRPDGSRASVARVAPVVMVGLLANVLLPARLGDVVRAYLIGRREQLPFGSALGATALERVLDIATLSVMAFLAALATATVSWIVQGTGILAAAGFVVVVLLATVGLSPVLAILRWMAPLPVLGLGARAAIPRFEAFVHWSGGAHRRRAILLALAFNIVAWLSNAAMFYFIAQAVGVNLSPAGALLVMAVAVLSTAIPSAPASVGTFELAALTVAVALGVPRDSALALAILAHVVGLVPTIIGGPISLTILGGGLGSLSAAAKAESSAEVAPQPS